MPERANPSSLPCVMPGHVGLATARQEFMAGLSIAVLATSLILLALPWLAEIGYFSNAHLPSEDYLTFHVAVEAVAVAVAAMIFGVGWHAAGERGSLFLMVLSSSFLAVGLLDLGHLLSFPGMPVFVTPSGVEKGIDFWLAARFTAGAALLAAVALPPGRADRAWRYMALALALCWTGLIYWLVLVHPDWLPDTFVAGQGLTPFKIGAEYFIIALHGAAALIVLGRHDRQLSYGAQWVFSALVVMMASELLFTLYLQVNELNHLLGHLSKFVAYALLYRGIFVVAVKQPYRELAASEKTVRESEARFRMMFESAPDAVFLLDEAGRICLANAMAERIFGYNQEEMLGSLVEMLLPEDVHASHVLYRAAYAENPVQQPMGTRRDLSARRKDGVVIPVAISLSPLLSEEQQKIVAVVRDISATREIEALLQRHSQEFQALVDNAPDVIVRFDRELRFLYANPAIEPFVGLGHYEVLGKTWDELGFEAGLGKAWQQVVEDVFASGQESVAEWLIDLPECGQRYFHSRAVPERDMENQIVSVLMIARDISERKGHEIQLRHQATHDSLTELPNRVLVLDRLQQAIQQALRNGNQLAVVYLDVDHFKNVNDTLGHAAGDELLQHVSARLAATMRGLDTVGRQGGDEFILLLPDIHRTQEVATVAEKILAALSFPFLVGEREVHVSASLGISVYPADGEDAETLLSRADIAMYRAKEEGRNTFCFFTADMDARMRARVELEQDLRLAVERNELALHFQPQVSLVSGAVVGMEALVRWNHPREGMVMPGRFIGVAEDSGLIVPIGNWVLETACRQARAWQDAGLPPVRMAVNLSARQFRDPSLVPRVARVLVESRLAPELLELEITESTVMHDTEAAIATLKVLKDLGVTLSVDDFGTGYSSLSYLKLFPIDVLKVDRSFVSDATTNPDDAAIVRTIVNMAHSLGLSVIAEGAETVAQVAFLHYVGCNELQGYYFSRPLPQDEAEQLLREGRRLDVSGFGRERSEPRLLIVDDEEAARHALSRSLRDDDRYRILNAGSAKEAMEALATHGAQVILCDHHLPGMSGMDFLSRVSRTFPESIRIILSGDSNAHLFDSALGSGVAHGIVRKPWNDDELNETIQAAFLHHSQGVFRPGHAVPLPHPGSCCRVLDCERRVQ
ncbi:MAG: EAL domain-containing protein [Sulfuricella denitrificans]|nr:EAL domain-containing protein [Sulfuricella denitrificans]